MALSITWHVSKKMWPSRGLKAKRKIGHGHGKGLSMHGYIVLIVKELITITVHP